MYSEWCHSVFDMLAEGGSWGVPRSGLTFRKQQGAFVLINRMPHMEGWTDQNLREYQDADYEMIKQEFERAGIEVRKHADIV